MVIVSAVLVARRHFTPPNLAVLMLLYHVPTALIAASFMLQELPQYEIPPLPRRCAEPTWAAAPTLPIGPGERRAGGNIGGLCGLPGTRAIACSINPPWQPAWRG